MEGRFLTVAMPYLLTYFLLSRLSNLGLTRALIARPRPSLRTLHHTALSLSASKTREQKATAKEQQQRFSIRISVLSSPTE
jgi:hypothetical protein